MKNIITPILLLALFFNVSADARTTESFTGYQEFRSTSFENLSVNGSADFRNVKLTNGSITGDVEFEDLIVKKKLDVTGNVFGLEGVFHKLHVIGATRLGNARIEHLEVTGPTTLKNSSVGEMHIIGFFKATNSVLGNIDATTNSVILQDSKAGVIRVRKSGAIEQKLTLNNSSAKEVIFESGNGRISIVGNAEIAGKIVGGIIVQE